MERNFTDRGCQMNHHHLLLCHGNQPQICSSNILNSQHATDYNHWLSTMAYTSDVYDPSCYDRCIARQYFNYEQSYPCSSQRGLHSRSLGQDQCIWPESCIMSSPRCRTAMHDCGVFPNEMRSSFMSKMEGSSYMHSMQEIYEQTYKESLANPSNLNQYPSKMKDNKAWTSPIRQLEFKSDYMTDEDFERDYIEIDELNSDYNITSMLCGLEEVLSRLI